MRRLFLCGLAAAGAILLVSCAAPKETTTAAKPKMTKQSFGKTSAGEEADRYILTNSKGMEVSIISYGATVISIKTPDRSGKIADVVLGLDNVAEYETKGRYLGSTIGRYGNRIAKGKFKLGGKEFTLATNNNQNHLHGGNKGFDKYIWTGRDVSTPEAPAVEFTHTSKDGDEGYPGTLAVKVTFTLTEQNELKIDYAATTDKETVVNLTNHSFFNLAGEGDVLGHEAQINAARFTPVDSTLIPTGVLMSVEGTPFDFRKPVAIGARIGDADEQLKFGRGYDHNYVLDSPGGPLALAARVSEPKTGRVMEVLTTEPGLQFYTGNFLDGSVTGRNGRVFGFRNAFCMETQHFPDSPNQKNFPSTVLKPGEQYKTATVYRFLTQ